MLKLCNRLSGMAVIATAMRVFESAVEQIKSAFLKPVWDLSRCWTWDYIGRRRGAGAEKALLTAYLGSSFKYFHHSNQTDCKRCF